MHSSPCYRLIQVRGREGFCTGTRDTGFFNISALRGQVREDSTRRVPGRWGNRDWKGLCYLLLCSLVRLDTPSIWLKDRLGNTGQLGAEDTEERALEDIRPVLSLCSRTKPDGPRSLLMRISRSALSGFVSSLTHPVTQLSSCRAWNSIFRTP